MPDKATLGILMSRCHTLWLAYVGWATQERLQIFHRTCLQHVPNAGAEVRPVSLKLNTRSMMCSLLVARTPSSLADLYWGAGYEMADHVLAAHEDLDRAVDAAYPQTEGSVTMMSELRSCSGRMKDWYSATQTMCVLRTALDRPVVGNLAGRSANTYEWSRYNRHRFT